MSDDGFFKDVDENEQGADNAGAQLQSQTQPDVTNLLNDIFGDSDDEDEQKTRQLPTKPADYDDEDDNIFADSDEDESRPKGRLQKKSTSQALKPTSKSALDEDGLLDSDDEEVKKAVKLAKKRKHADKLLKKKKKTHMLEPSSKKHRPSTTPGAIPSRSDLPGAEGEDKEVSSGGEYDSGEEAPEDENDRAFIDKNDDHADLLAEYNEDNQNFDDEDPDEGYGSSKKKKPSKSSASSSNRDTSNVGGVKASDPLSLTLAEMKNPKVKEIADMEKEQYVEKLQKKMAKAIQLDNECIAKGEPGIHKLKLLPILEQSFNMKSIQNTLLERDILASLRDFIEPRDSKTLPSLAVRTAVYNILLKLSVTVDHLKRVVDSKPPIGVIIVQLRKHKMETPENKRLLKEIMDKWSRPIFAKSTDVRSNGGMTALLQENAEVQDALLQKYANVDAANAAASGNKNVKVSDLLSGNAPKTANPSDYFNRARTPYSQGFLFTVQPELKSVDKTDIMEKTLGEGRMKLYKKMSSAGAVRGDGLGRKVNPRAMDMSVSHY